MKCKEHGNEFRYTADDAKAYMTQYLAKDGQGFSELLSVDYVRTAGGIRETCGGCTLGDGQDCRPPSHYVDEFVAVCQKRVSYQRGYQGQHVPYVSAYIRYSYLSMGWAEGGCSNAYPDVNDVHHFRYYDDYYRDSYTSYEELLAYLEKISR